MVRREGLRDRLLGGVGGMSPVRWTSVSTEVQRSLRALMGVMVKMLISAGEVGAGSSEGGGEVAEGLIPASAEGSGGVGGSVWVVPFVAMHSGDR